MLRMVLLIVLVFVGTSMKRVQEKNPQQQSDHMQRFIGNTTGPDFLLYLPPTYSESLMHYPLLLFLHGAGERGANLDLVKLHGPPKMIAEGQNFPFIVVSPQCPAEEEWFADTLKALIDKVIKTYRVDETRIYVTGLSMGGYGTWAFAQKYPDRIAAIVPICGGGDPDRVQRIKDIPTWVFHGAKDAVVGLVESANMVNALYVADSDVRFTVYPDAGHVEAWEKAYADEALWIWLIRQQKAVSQGK